MQRAWRAIPLVLVATVVGACALEGTHEASRSAAATEPVHPLAQHRALPAWHPPVPGWASALPEGHPPVVRLPALPEGHPPVARMPTLPQGHPPVPGWQSPLPEGHPACPALGNGSERGATIPVSPRPARLEVIRT